MERIDYLASRFFDQTCTEDEREELARWIAAQPNDDEVLPVLETAWQHHHADAQLPEATSELILSALFQQPDRADEPTGVVRSLYPARFWWRAAAAVVLVAGLGLASYSWLHRTGRTELAQAKPAAPAKPADAAPGGNKAMLTLGDGSVIVLDSAQNGALGRQGSATILKPASGELVYTAAGAKTGAVVYNTITTPNGGQYQVRLPDGTEAWLNAASSLRFPTAFVGSERRVFVSGEVYFEVAHDAGKPFRAQVQDMDVTVLGTHFNLMAYANERTIRTTLLEGRVTVTQAGRTVSLRPGQQARLTQDRASLKVVDGVDTDEVVAWKNGQFQFDDASLSDIMRQVERWYNVDVVYEGTPPAGHFTGKLSRNTNLSAMLRIFTLSDIRYRLDEKQLIISQ